MLHYTYSSSLSFFRSQCLYYMIILVMAIALATAIVVLLSPLGSNTDEKWGGVADEGVQVAPTYFGHLQEAGQVQQDVDNTPGQDALLLVVDLGLMDELDKLDGGQDVEDQTPECLYVRTRHQVPNGVKKDVILYLAVTAGVILTIVRFTLLGYEIRLRLRYNIINIYNI